MNLIKQYRYAIETIINAIKEFIGIEKERYLLVDLSVNDKPKKA